MLLMIQLYLSAGPAPEAGCTQEVVGSSSKVHPAAANLLGAKKPSDKALIWPGLNSVGDAKGVPV